MKNFKKVSIQTILLITIALLFVVSLQATFAVDQSINDTSTGGIRGAIGNASAGDTVTLAPGTYNKTGNDTNFAISKNITLKGNGSTNSVIIDAQGLSRIFTINNNLNVTFINITFINGYVTGSNGGAILNNYTGSRMTFIDCTFINNTARQNGVNTGRGGAIYNAGNNLAVTGSIFINNTGSSEGGAICLRSGVNNVAIDKCVFDGNNAYSGGAIHNYLGRNMVVTNSNFTNNTAVDLGGAIYNRADDTIISGSNFTDNKATGTTDAGGAIYIYISSNVSIINCNFTGNNGTSGGAIQTYHCANMSVSNSYFINNTATSGNGGAILLNANDLVIMDSNFTGNNANGSGGAIHNYLANVKIYTSNFTSNNATTAGGGAVTNVGGTTIAKMAVYDSIFTSNNANYGGAIYNSGTGAMNVSGSIFTSNNADGSGGAIRNIGNMTVLGNTMTGNSANSGQMIYNSGNMGILNLTYLGNSTVKTSKGSLVTIYAILTDDMGNTVTGEDISFYVDGVFIANVTSIEGKANTTYLVTQDPVSVLPVTGDYAGHEGYSIVLKNGELLVLKIPTKIIVSLPKEVKVGDTVTLESKLTDEDGNPLAGKTVDFYVDGKKVGFGVTDSNGIAKLNYTFNKAGKPNVEAKFAGDNTYLASNATNQTTVSKIKTTITVKTDKDKIIATLTDENGNLLANKKVTITINGKTYTRTTDSNGQVIINYKNAWNYKVTAKFAGDEKYLASKASAPKRTATKITIDRQGNKVIVTLKDKKGRVLAFKTVRVVIDGQEFVGTTDENGQFIIQYKNPKRFTITAKFDGDDMYIESEATLPAEPVANTKSDAAMKETGLPISTVLLSIFSILCTLGFGIRRTQN